MKFRPRRRKRKQDDESGTPGDAGAATGEEAGGQPADEGPVAAANASEPAAPAGSLEDEGDAAAAEGEDEDDAAAAEVETKRKRRRLRRPRFRRRRREEEQAEPAPSTEAADPGSGGEAASAAEEGDAAAAEAPETRAEDAPGAPAELTATEPEEAGVVAPEAVAEAPNSIAVRDAGAILLDSLSEYVPGAREHADATATYSFATAVELGVPRQQSELIREVARLHEIGKVYVPSAIASHPRSELLPGERRELDAHHEQGRSLAIGAGLGEEVAGWILAARERYDGRGPEGLAGRAIPLAARIIRAACAYHEGTRLRRAARWRGEPREAGLARIRAESGDELDPEVVEALSRVLGRAASRAGGGRS